jgi:hypothetical protein
MEYGEHDLEVLADVRALHQARAGAVFVPTDEASESCERLADAGWLERRRVTANGESAFRWSAEAETALDLAEITNVHDRQN